MLSTRSRTSRTVAVTFALAGALGLSACQDSSPDAAPPTSAAPTSATESSSAPETSESSAAPETSESSSSSSSESSSSESPSSSGGDAGDTTPVAPGTTLKYGQAANVVESSTASSSAAAYRLQVDALEKAPDSVYTGNVTKADGIVYFLRYTVTNNGGSQSSTFDAGDVNGFMLKPKLGPDQEGKKFVSAPGCDSDDTDLAVGESGKGCDAYIAKGAEIKDVVFAPGSRIQVSWTP